MQKLLLACVLAIFVLIFVCLTWHWPFVGDEALIRYANFLMHHGMAPYRDVVEINMPGAFAVDWLVVHIYGSSSLAWRMFDFSLMAVVIFAALAIAWPYDWLAGIYGSALFILIHGRDGVVQSGQRDLTIGVLLLAAVALLFHAHRRNYWPATALFGLFCGAASTIKPTVLPLGFILLFLLSIDLRRQRLSVMRHWMGGIVGLLAPLLLVLAFLLRERALPAFLYTMHTLIPYHASIGRLPLSYFLWHSFASTILPIVLLWLILAIVHKHWRTWEQHVLLVCVAFGWVSLMVQGKDYPYHRYPLEIFLLLLAGIEFTAALRDRGIVKILGIAGLIFGIFVLAPISTVKLAHYQWKQDEFRAMLQTDLNQLGGKNLSGHIQCVDTIGGCIATLDQMRLVQATGFLYDCYLFTDKPGSVQTEYRTRFWQALQKNPPRVFVVTNQLCINPPGTFQKLERWPQFDAYLRDHYTIDMQRKPPDEVRWWIHPTPPTSYRIYVRSN